MSAMYVGPGSVPGTALHSAPSPQPGTIHLRLLLLTLGLYVPFLGVGLLAHAREPFISLTMVWLGPLSPLYVSAIALRQGLLTESLFGGFAVVPAALWFAAVRWPTRAWLEWGAGLGIIALYGVLFLALAMST